MKSLQEAKTSAENENTEAVKKFRKAAFWYILAPVIVVFTVNMFQMIREYQRESAKESSVAPATSREVPMPLASTDESTWPQVVIRNGKSADIPRPHRARHIETVGLGSGNYTLHSVYTDDTECTLDHGCPEGAVKKYYVTGTEGKVVRYAFVPK